MKLRAESPTKAWYSLASSCTKPFLALPHGTKNISSSISNFPVLVVNVKLLSTNSPYQAVMHLQIKQAISVLNDKWCIIHDEPAIQYKKLKST